MVKSDKVSRMNEALKVLNDWDSTVLVRGFDVILDDNQESKRNAMKLISMIFLFLW